MSARAVRVDVHYTGRVRTVGSRDGGVSRSDDGRLALTHAFSRKPGKGSSPEQLLAAGWSACLQAAIDSAAAKLRLVLPADAAIDAEIDRVQGEDGDALQARLRFSMPGLSLDRAQALVDTAHQTCPYSKAMRGSISVESTLA